jgi:chemotaxis protein methyltransferase CheR
VEEIDLKDIKRIIEAIKESIGVDFNNYAFSSFKRRVIRFVEINKIRDLSEFITQIKNDRNYTDNLVKEITVNVTEMFRDPSFWVVLRDKILTQISSKSPFNIWHAACSTGEEVYSMAILLKESNLLKQARIVATDLNSNVIQVAEKGIYTLKNQLTNSKNYEQFGGKALLSDYYTVNDNNVQFDKKLIENVDFRCHNLVQDGPISEFDLILCRNVLIYFNFELQEKVIQTFNKSMQVGSFLGIGSKESIRWCKDTCLFDAENLDEKVYRKVVDKKYQSNINVYKTE